MQVPGIYRHYKNKFYYAEKLATCSETGIDYVVYHALYGDYKTYIRPLEMFCEQIDADRADNTTGQLVRFELVNEIK